MLIKNGWLIDPATDREDFYELRIEDGKVQEVAKKIEPKENEEIIDASGCWIIPGAIDLHVHLREPGFEHKETIETGSKSAAKGGVTTVCAMPNTKPVVDNVDVVEKIYAKAKEKALVNVLQMGAITKGQDGKELADLAGMMKAGICGLSEDGKSVMDGELFEKAVARAKELGIAVFSHCEDIDMAHGCMNEGPTSRKLNLPGIPKEAEDKIADRDMQLNKKYGGQLHLCHVSTATSVDLIRQAKKADKRLSAEVCPHHFTLTEEVVDGINTNTKMNPPLREQVDVDALKQGLKDGTIDVIATDHAPHHPDEKAKSFIEAPNGIIGLETMIPLTITELVRRGVITPRQFVEKISLNPAKILGIDKGSLEEGKTADITLVDPEESYEISQDDFASKSINTPFIGKKVWGRVKTTIVSGQVVYKY